MAGVMAGAMPAAAGALAVITGATEAAGMEAAGMEAAGMEAAGTETAVTTAFAGLFNWFLVPAVPSVTERLRLRCGVCRVLGASKRLFAGRTDFWPRGIKRRALWLYALGSVR
jgi:hypothetical protein